MVKSSNRKVQKFIQVILISLGQILYPYNVVQLSSIIISIQLNDSEYFLHNKMKMLRWSIGPTKMEKRRNTNVREQLDVVSIQTKIKEA